jgi:putative addiction module component (TIGR02574 family)
MMFDLVEELSQKSQALRPQDKARLAELLLDSIHRREDAAIDVAWDLELARRIDEVERGTAKLVSAEDAFAQVREAIR